MSRTRPTQQEQSVLAEVCPLCRAGSGAWCRTIHGTWSDTLHSNRWQVYSHRLEMSAWQSPAHRSN